MISTLPDSLIEKSVSGMKDSFVSSITFSNLFLSWERRLIRDLRLLQLGTHPSPVSTSKDSTRCLMGSKGSVKTWGIAPLETRKGEREQTISGESGVC